MSVNLNTSRARPTACYLAYLNMTQTMLKYLNDQLLAASFGPRYSSEYTIRSVNSICVIFSEHRMFSIFLYVTVLSVDSDFWPRNMFTKY